jgi:hypothetical protein
MSRIAPVFQVSEHDRPGLDPGEIAGLVLEVPDPPEAVFIHAQAPDQATIHATIQGRRLPARPARPGRPDRAGTLHGEHNVTLQIEENRRGIARLRNL